MNNYNVYRLTSPSDKVYIGITCQAPEQRWRGGRGYSHQRYISKAIQKYGWENFSREVLFSGLTQEEASLKEVELIAYHKSNQREFGYNIDGGGINKIVTDETRQRLRESHLGKKSSSETRQKISDALKGRHNPHAGEPLSEYHRQRISEGLKGRIVTEETRQKIREGNTGKKMSADSRKKMSDSHKGLKPSPETVAKWKASNQSIMTPVEQLDKTTGETIARFDSTMDAHRSTGVCSSSISACCKGKRKTAGGYIWRYECRLTDIEVKQNAVNESVS